MWSKLSLKTRFVILSQFQKEVFIKNLLKILKNLSLEGSHLASYSEFGLCVSLRRRRDSRGQSACVYCNFKVSQKRGQQKSDARTRNGKGRNPPNSILYNLTLGQVSLSTFIL